MTTWDFVRHGADCPDGHEKTPAAVQRDEGHSIHLSAGADEKTTAIVATAADKPPVEHG